MWTDEAIDNHRMRKRGCLTPVVSSLACGYYFWKRGEETAKTEARKGGQAVNARKLLNNKRFHKKVTLAYDDIKNDKVTEMRGLGNAGNVNW